MHPDIRTEPRPPRRTSIVLRAAELGPEEAEAVRGRRVLFLLANEGHAVQEVLLPMAALEAVGVRVDLVAWRGGDVRFDPVCDGMARVESFWSAIGEQRRAARVRGRFQGLASIAETGSLDPYDALVVPGGHGAAFGAFLRDREVHELVARAAREGLWVALECHAVALAAMVPDTHGAPLGKDRHLTCWPRSMESALARLGPMRSHFMPLGEPVQTILERVTAFVHAEGAPSALPDAVVDGPLVTGWGPWSAEGYGRALARLLAVGRPGGAT